MHRIFNRFLLFIFVSLIILLSFRILSNSSNKVVPIAHSTIDQPSQKEFDQKHIESIVDDYIMNNPHLIISSIEQMQMRKSEELADKVKCLLEDKKSENDNSPTSPFLGNKKGNLNVTVFFDYNCGHCKKSAPVIEALLKDPVNSDVKILLKPYPVIDPTSMYLTQVALAVYKNHPDKFAQIHKKLLESEARPSNEAVDKILSENGIDIEKIKLAVADNNSDHAIPNAIKKTFELASSLKIDSVPTYIINGQIVPGNLTSENFQAIINDIRNNIATGKNKTDNKSGADKQKIENKDDKTKSETKEDKNESVNKDNKINPEDKQKAS